MSRDVHDQMLVIDALNTSNWDRELFQEALAGSVDCVNATLALWEDARTTLDTIGHWYRLFDQNTDLAVHVRSGADIEAAKAAGKLAVILGFQNASPFEDDLALVSIFHALGVRVVQLTYNNQNLLGGGCYEPVDSGLTRFGRNVIVEMNRLGMVVDLSHVGERTSLDAIAASARPVAITHSNPAFFHAHPRNKSNELLKALAERGGVLGCGPYSHLIGGAEVPLRKFCEMIARTVDLMGIDHVGIGTDTSLKHRHPDRLTWARMGRWTFEPNWGAGKPGEGHFPPPWPEWYRTPSDMPNITQGLLEIGMSNDEVARVMGLNWLRVFSDGFRPA